VGVVGTAGDERAGGFFGDARVDICAIAGAASFWHTAWPEAGVCVLVFICLRGAACSVWGWHIGLGADGAGDAFFSVCGMPFVFCHRFWPAVLFHERSELRAG